MDAKEKRARELLAALVKIRDSTFRDAAALRGIADMAINSDRAGDFNAAALTPPEGYVLVPVEPTYEMMTDACKTVIAMAEMKAPLGKLDPFTVSDCVWKAMLSACPEVPNVND